jgi:hypothetical protein
MYETCASEHCSWHCCAFDLVNTLSNSGNEGVCELVEGPDRRIVKCKFKRLLWAGHIVQWITLEYQKSNKWKISWKKTCGKTTAKMGRHQEGLVAAKYKRMEETSRGHLYKFILRI